ncbi:MAG TPA: hypothetical protein VFH63_11010 [candidate division Zixibacteria bacterium]|nr:hypothetical protein [candidate division Zixibacteria bacterium]
MPVEASRRMTAVSRRVLERGAGAGGQPALELLGAQRRRPIVGDGRRAHAGYRRIVDLVLVHQPAEDVLEGPID